MKIDTEERGETKLPRPCCNDNCLDMAKDEVESLHAELLSCTSRIMKTAFQVPKLPLWSKASKTRHNWFYKAWIERGLVSYTIQGSFSHQRTHRDGYRYNIQISHFVRSHETQKNGGQLKVTWTAKPYRALQLSSECQTFYL
jgi:hypothetical protein